jgi:hypothetical protein
VNIFLGLIGGWLALLDRCVITASEMPMSHDIIVLLLLQASIGMFVLLFVNGVFPVVAAMATEGRSTRMKLIVFAIPLILFVSSPAIISDALYRARYGNINKFVVHAHVGHDLKCCLNPFVHGVARAVVVVPSVASEP